MNPLGMFTSVRGRASALLMLACLGCRSQERSADEAPAATLTLDAFPVVVDGRAIPVVASWEASSGQRKAVVEPRNATVEPPELARIYNGKELRCARHGKGVVRIRVGDQVASAPLNCLLAPSLGQARSNRPLRLVLGSAPEPSGIHAVRSGGMVDDGVAVSVTSDAPEVLAVDGDLLVPRKLGRARITGTAEGPLEKTWTFEVVKRIGFWQVRKPFQPISVELEPGRYELTFESATEEVLTVKWTSLPQCDYSSKASSHVVNCPADRRTRMIAYPPRKERAVVDYLELLELPP